MNEQQLKNIGESECYQPIEGFKTNYFVSNYGNVISI
jgi:hypothetical protein